MTELNLNELTNTAGIKDSKVLLKLALLAALLVVGKIAMEVVANEVISIKQ